MAFVYECGCGLFRAVKVYPSMVRRELVTQCDRCGRERVFSAAAKYAQRYREPTPVRKQERETVEEELRRTREQQGSIEIERWRTAVNG